MAIYQLFVKLLDGRTQCIQIPSPILSGETLRRDLVARTGIPFQYLRLVSGTREVSDESLLSSSPDGLFPSLSLLLRLPGGKGGFGSLLRGAATKAGQKKTNNFDACRDMSGRRLRHVNAEKKLEEWKAEAEDRRLEKLAEDFLRKKAKEVKKDSKVAVDKYLEKYRADAEKCIEEVEESVRESFALYKESKRKILPLSEPSSKRLKIWMGKKKMEDSDTDGDDSEIEDEDDGNDNRNKKSVVQHEGNCSNQEKLEEGSSPSSSASGETLDGGSGNSNSDGVNEDGVLTSLASEQGSGSGDSNSDSDGTLNSVTGVRKEVALHIDVDCAFKKVSEASMHISEIEQSETVQKEAELVNKDQVSGSTNISSPKESLNFDNYDSASELEQLGMERLKVLLLKYGLKCGGTLHERASRLFLLKTTPMEKLPKKVLAKP